MSTFTSLRILAACLLAAVLSLARFAPRISVLEPEAGAGYGVMRVADLTGQLADPLGWGHSREAPTALRWRLLPPVAGHLLHLRPATYLALPLLGAAVLLVWTAACVFRETQSVVLAGLTASLAATASWFFVATGWTGQFDVFYLLGLVAVVFSPSRLAIGAACALAPWCDERFLLILPACLCLRAARDGAVKPRQLLALAAAGIAPYVLLRTWALCHGDSTLGEHIALQRSSLGTYLPRVPDGWWMGFRAGWLFIVLGVFHAGAALRPKGGLLLAASLVAGLGAIILAAWDISRSIAVLLPFLIFGAIFLHRRWPRIAWKLALALAVLNLTMPAAHVVENHHIPIPPFWHGIHR